MPKVFSAIARLIYYSNGGFSYEELYEGMPVYVRRHMIDEIENIKKEEKKAMEDGNSGTSSAPKGPPEDIGQVMEKMEKRADTDGDHPALSKEEKENPQSEAVRQSTPEPQKKEPEAPEPEADSAASGDPAKAEDLNHLIDKLKQDQ